ncbi:MAG: type II toxin-antitoxin system VapC family toxin [Ignavibacteria bacterium]
MNNKPLKVIQKFLSIPSGEIGISSIILSELWFGAYKSSYPKKNAIALNKFISELQVIPFDYSCSEIYGKIRFELEKKEKNIGAMDLLIAAIALSNNLVLVTNNTREFKRIKQLKIENWV